MCQLYRIPFNPELVRSFHPPPHSVASVLEAAKALGFHCAASHAEPGALAALALPALLLIRAKEEGASTGITLALLLAHKPESVLVLRAGAREPESIPEDDFAAEYLGEAIQFYPQGKPVGEDEPFDDRATAASRETRERFGFRWFIPELLKHKRIWRDVLAASLVIQILGLAVPLFTQVIIDKVVVHHTVNTLTVLVIALIVVMLFSSGMSWVRQYLVLHTGNRVDAVLGTRVFEHVLTLSPRYFEARATGNLVARLHGVETIREFVSGAAVSLVLDLPFLVIFLAIMFAYSWQLTLIALAIVGTIASLSLAVVPLFRTRLNEQFLLGARNQSFLTEYLAGMQTVKSLQMEPQLKTRYGDYIAAYLGAAFKTKTIANGYNVTANALEQAMTLAILGAGAWLVMQNNGFTIGMLVAFQMFSGRLSQPMLRLVGLWQEFQQAAMSVRRLGDLMDAPSEPYSLIPQRAPSDTVDIEIERLGFRYAEDLPFLYQGLSLTLKAGQCIALMGPSGSGKSTLAKLLQGFYLPTEGRILLNGRDVRNLAANELRTTFGVVPQETVLFAGTIYDNLILAHPHATFAEVIHACKMAEIHEVIERLPQGYQTEIGERGSGLSGGQRQRIAIARALLKRPKVLILDEASANLDQETAEQFAKTINALRGKVTMLFIAHQLPRGLEVDAVVRLEAVGAGLNGCDAVADLEVGN